VRYDATDAQGNPAAQLARRVTVTSGARAAVTAPFVEDEAPVTWYDLDLIADFHLLDMNHDRRISLEEIAAFVDGGSESIPPEDYYHLNSDGDIGLTLPELHNWSDPLSPEPGYGNITSDTDGDYVLSFPELLRMIQLYNAGGYTCAEVPGATEDSFLPRPPIGSDPICVKHTLDLDTDFSFQISLSELLRGIQFYTLGGYRNCDQTVDGGDYFCGPSGV
jgi:hypothetical protein